MNINVDVHYYYVLITYMFCALVLFMAEFIHT